MLVQLLWSCTFASWTPPPLSTFSITLVDFFEFIVVSNFSVVVEICVVVFPLLWCILLGLATTKKQHTHNITKTPPFHCDLILPTLQNFIILAKNAQPKNKNNGGRIFFLCSSVGWLAAAGAVAVADVAPLWYDHFTHKVILFVYFFLLLHSLLLLQLFS